MKKIIILVIGLLVFFPKSYSVNFEKSTTVCFETNYGNITVKLYPETVKHRLNFLKLVNDGFYNGILFHRVIANFMIQAGDPLSKNASTATLLGGGDVGYTVPAEIVCPTYYHKRGALCAARKGDKSNPLKASSGCQFYIVQGRTYSEDELDRMEKSNEQKLEAKLFQDSIATKLVWIKKYQEENNQTKLDSIRDETLLQIRSKIRLNPTYKFSAQQRADYKMMGGTPHLDGDYTVFGEVVEGLDIVAKISTAETANNDKPVQNIVIIKAVIKD